MLVGYMAFVWHLVKTLLFQKGCSLPLTSFHIRQIHATYMPLQNAFAVVCSLSDWRGI